MRLFIAETTGHISLNHDALCRRGNKPMHSLIGYYARNLSQQSLAAKLP
jgi:hypothetical protein